MWDLIDEELGKKSGAPKGETIKKYSQDLIALKRVSTGDDVAKLVSFLAGPDSDYGEFYFHSQIVPVARCADSVVAVTGQTQLVSLLRRKC